MSIKAVVCILAVCIVAVCNGQQQPQAPPPPPPKFNFAPPTRAPDNFKVFGNGGGSAKQGIDLNLGAQAKIWESQNQRNSLHGTGTYSQHLGGPYGNSRPNMGGGLTFTHRF